MEQHRIEHTIDLGRGSGCVSQNGGGTRDLGRHSLIVAKAGVVNTGPLIIQGKLHADVLVAKITNGVVENLAALLGTERRVPDNMDDGNILTVGTAYSAESAQLSGAEGCDQGTGAVDAGVAIGSICASELVGRSNPREAFRLNLVEKSKFVVYVYK